MGSDNRKHERVVSRLRCWCESEDVTVYARIGNLSEGGLFLRTSTPLPSGARARVRLADGESDELTAAATVVWSQAHSGHGQAGMGLRFEGMDDQSLERIRRLIGEQARWTDPAE